MITNIDKIVNTISQHGSAFAEVRNPAYVFPPVEYYPLAAPQQKVSRLKAALMDMDGTTTTTEVLCIHSLDVMLQRMSGRTAGDDRAGIIREADLPHIIGNSTTKHVEYLITTYREMITVSDTAASFIAAAAETLAHSTDHIRKQEVILNIRKLNIPELIDDIKAGTGEEQLLARYAHKITGHDFTTLVNLGIDIYYAVYHNILTQLKMGRSDLVRKMIPVHQHGHRKLISPMPGIPILIPLLKGWLGAEASLFADELLEDYRKSNPKKHKAVETDRIRLQLGRLGSMFEQQPVKIALVTSSIFYEADIVIKEVLNEMASHIQASKLSRQRKEYIMNAYKNYHRVYDAFVTATDSSEIRLKPHRDLYSIALHRLGINPVDFANVVGFEDSQSGTIAIRAAGVGCCVAVPFAETAAHNLEAATHILHGGIPQAIIEFGLFLE
ncbi:MAG: hypothetical protein RG741_00020 [Bacteroidales bacterium]|nr:hypothetical protein [Bacteroidales bacterium]